MKKIILILLLFLLSMLASLLALRACAPESAESVPTPEYHYASPSPSPTPTPSPSPSPTAEELRLARARELLGGMSTHEKVCQLFILRPEALTGAAFTDDPEIWQSALEAYPVGGVFFAANNLSGMDGTTSAIAVMQSASATPLFIAVDEEGGAVARVASTLGTTAFSPMFNYRDAGVSTAYENTLTIAGDISALGFNLDFAPVADVWTNPANTVIGTRAYSDDPEEAATLVAAAVEGFSDGGVLSVLKHFPGHGDTAEDSHFGLATNGKSLAELYDCELKPFIAGMEAGADMVMTAHILLPQLDAENPATLSYAVTTELLRGTLGFDGVIITDALEMGALAGYTDAEIAVRAIEAGADLLLAPNDPAAAIEAVTREITPERLDESVLRILLLKLEKGIIA